MQSLQHRRRSLSTKLFALGEHPASRATATFQRDLAAEILWAERAQAVAPREERSAYRDHIRLLRAHGDALAWLLLHPHAIRQFRKGGIRGQALASQGDAVEAVLGIAEEIATDGVIALVTDVTADLRLGDIIVVDDPEAPSIIECKNKLPPDGSLLLGRKGRQAARIQGTAEYLDKGIADLHDEPMTRRVFESSRPQEPRWQDIREATDRALNERRGHIRTLEPGVVMWVRYADEDPPAQLAEALAGFRSLRIGAHVRFLEDDAPLMPPPLAWPVSEDARWHLTEGDLCVVILLDVERFADIATERGRRIVVHDDLPALEVQHERLGYVVSWRFVDDCVYNFLPIADQVDTILELVDQAFAEGVVPPGALDVPAPRPAGTPQRVHRVQTEGDMLRLAERQPGERDSVLIAGDLWAKLAPDQKPRVVYWQTGPAKEQDK